MPKFYHLTFQDAHTGRCLTDRFPENTMALQILSRMETERLLSVPWLSAGIENWGNSMDFRPLSRLNVRDGDTLLVDCAARWEKRLQNTPALERLRKEYPLAFFRKVNGVCTGQIAFVGYGYETPEDTFHRMARERNLCIDPGKVKYQLLYWPDTWVEWYAPGVSRRVSQYLCEVDPEPGRVVILEEQPVMSRSDVPCPLYGCPRADMPIQTAALQNRIVDVIRYE